MFGFVSGVLAEKGRQVYTVSKAAPVDEAVREMNEKGIGALLVVERGLPVGMFTERDVLRRIVDADRDPALTHVGEVMTKNVLTITPEMQVADVMALMTERRCRHLPVISEGAIVGMVSIGDLLRWIMLNQENELRLMAQYIAGASASG